MILPSDIIERATEVVKNLQNIFDKLFEILTSQENELRTREQEKFGIPIDLNKIHQTAFHALVRTPTLSIVFAQRKVYIRLDLYSGSDLHEAIRILPNSAR